MYRFRVKTNEFLTVTGKPGKKNILFSESGDKMLDFNLTALPKKRGWASVKVIASGKRDLIGI